MSRSTHCLTVLFHTFCCYFFHFHLFVYFAFLCCQIYLIDWLLLGPYYYYYCGRLNWLPASFLSYVKCLHFDKLKSPLRVERKRYNFDFDLICYNINSNLTPSLSTLSCQRVTSYYSLRLPACNNDEMLMKVGRLLSTALSFSLPVITDSSTRRLWR